MNKKAITPKVKNCPEIPYFGANYPDARCVDGQLFDLDRCDENGNLFEMFEYVPCPFCDEEGFIEHVMESGNNRQEIINWIEKMRNKYG